MVLNVVAVFIKCNVASFTWISTIHVNTFITPFFQAQARCHRIGQTKEVKVYRLITRNSYEREMFDKASLKLGLDKAVLQSMGSDKNAPVSCYRLCQKFMKVFLPWWKIKPTQTKLEKIYECWFRWNWCRIYVYLFIWISFILYFLNFW